MKKAVALVCAGSLLLAMAVYGTKTDGSIEAQTTLPQQQLQAAQKTSSKTSGQTTKIKTEKVYLDSSWEYADHAKIKSGYAVLYQAPKNRREIVIAVNAGHGTKGGSSVKTLCHPDGSAKVTGGTTAAGSIKAIAVSEGMSFRDGTAERDVTLRMAQILKKKLLEEGYDVLMVRDGADVQLDNVARTVICNNVAECHIALHWDSDGLSYDKGCFYASVPDKLKKMSPVSKHWEAHDALGKALIKGLRAKNVKINGTGATEIDLTQTSYSTIPSVDIELGNQCSDHSDKALEARADGLVQGINKFTKKYISAKALKEYKK